MRRDVIPSGDIRDVSFFDGGTKMLFQVHTFKTEEADLETGSVNTVLTQFDMQGTFVDSPNGQLVAGTALNGDEVVWDESPSDTPVAIPTSSPLSAVALARHELLITEGGTALSVLPDSYCDPLNEVVSLGESLVVHPTALAESSSYDD
jgi:hypothetical protein